MVTFGRTPDDAERQTRKRTLPVNPLSEVEALCDRVAILRNGELSDLGTMAELRQLSALDIKIPFRGPLPDLSSVAGLQVAGVDGYVIIARSPARWSRC